MFDAPIAYGATFKLSQVRDPVRYERKRVPVTAGGLMPFSRYVVRKKGVVEVGGGACVMCHARVMPDGALLEGAQGNTTATRKSAATERHLPMRRIRAVSRIILKMLDRRARQLTFVLALVACSPCVALCQPAADVNAAEQAPAAPPLTADAYVPITAAQRVDWIVDGTIGRRSLFVVGPLATVWQTGFNTPEEWGRGASGIAKRYAQREADVAISNTLEAGLGALWGEDPRYIPSGRKGIWPRARYAIKTVLLAQRRDGSLKPAWGRYAGNVFNNLIENVWLPPSVTTPGQTAWRSGLGLLGRLGGNAWEEFWPDVVRHFKKP